MPTPQIRALALCIFQHQGRILVHEAHDPVRGQRFCRPLGGGIDFGETSQQAVAREIREELGAEVAQLRLLGTLENIFTYRGEPHHEIVQVYDGAFVDASLYGRPWLDGTESDGSRFEARWRDMAYFSSAATLVPDGLPALLKTSCGL